MWHDSFICVPWLIHVCTSSNLRDMSVTNCSIPLPRKAYIRCVCVGGCVCEWVCVCVWTAPSHCRGKPIYNVCERVSICVSEYVCVWCVWVCVFVCVCTTEKEKERKKKV